MSKDNDVKIRLMVDGVDLSPKALRDLESIKKQAVAKATAQADAVRQRNRDRELSGPRSMSISQYPKPNSDDADRFFLRKRAQREQREIRDKQREDQATHRSIMSEKKALDSEQRRADNARARLHTSSMSGIEKTFAQMQRSARAENRREVGAFGGRVTAAASRLASIKSGSDALFAKMQRFKTESSASVDAWNPQNDAMYQAMLANEKARKGPSGGGSGGGGRVRVGGGGGGRGHFGELIGAGFLTHGSAQALGQIIGGTTLGTPFNVAGNMLTTASHAMLSTRMMSSLMRRGPSGGQIAANAAGGAVMGATTGAMMGGGLWGAVGLGLLGAASSAAGGMLESRAGTRDAAVAIQQNYALARSIGNGNLPGIGGLNRGKAFAELGWGPEQASAFTVQSARLGGANASFEALWREALMEASGVGIGGAQRARGMGYYAQGGRSGANALSSWSIQSAVGQGLKGDAATQYLSDIAENISSIVRGGLQPNMGATQSFLAMASAMGGPLAGSMGVGAMSAMQSGSLAYAGGFRGQFSGIADALDLAAAARGGGSITDILERLESRAATPGTTLAEYKSVGGVAGELATIARSQSVAQGRSLWEYQPGVDWYTTGEPAPLISEAAKIAARSDFFKAQTVVGESQDKVLEMERAAGMFWQAGVQTLEGILSKWFGR